MAISAKETEAQAGLKICPGQKEVTTKEKILGFGVCPPVLGLPWWFSSKEPICQRRRQQMVTAAMKFKDAYSLEGKL